MTRFDLPAIRERNDLAAIAGQVVALKRAGRKLKGPCPFHVDKTPSFFIMDDGAAAHFHCFAGETEVITRSGVRPIRELAGTVATILTRGGIWVDAPFMSYGRQQLWRIDLSRNGVRKTLHATAEHRWFVRDRSSAVPTKDLRIGARLEAVLPAPIALPELDPAGVRHGLVFGDGTRGTTRALIDLHGDNIELRCWFVGFRTHDYADRCALPTLRVTGMPLHYKDLPPLTKPIAYLAGFLAGYIAADGHVAKDGTAQLNCRDAETLEWVRTLCNQLGIGTYGVTLQMRRGYLAEPGPLHRVHFVSRQMPRKLIIRSQARCRLDASTKKFDRLRWSVAAVAPTDRTEEVFCAEVPEHHAFALADHILTGNCFGCGAHGDVIGFVMRTQALSFVEACRSLSDQGGLDDPRVLAAARERARRQVEAAQAAEAAHRERQRLLSRRIWTETERITIQSPALAYFDRRGIAIDRLPDARLPQDVRYHPGLEYWWSGDDGKPQVIATLPALTCAVRDNEGKGIAVEIRYLDWNGQDPDIVDPETGELLTVKKMRGNPWGGAIHLTPPGPKMRFGEGRESCLSVLMATPELPIWACLSIGNLAGGAKGRGRRIATPADPVRKFRFMESPTPDLENPAFIPPAVCRDAILVEDADNADPQAADALYTRAAARWKAAGLTAARVRPPAGCDFNDLVKRKAAA